jgi:hypothetical protein
MGRDTPLIFTTGSIERQHPPPAKSAQLVNPAQLTCDRATSVTPCDSITRSVEPSLARLDCREGPFERIGHRRVDVAISKHR